MYVHNPNLTFKPDENEHYVVFDSSSATLKNEYTIEFDQPFKNVVELTVEQAVLPRGTNSCLALHINGISSFEHSGVMDSGKIVNSDYLDNAFAVFLFDPSKTGSQRFSKTDIKPCGKRLQTPIGKLANLKVKWMGDGDTITDHYLVFKICTCG